MVTARMFDRISPDCSICKGTSSQMMEILSGAADTKNMLCVPCLRYIVTVFNDWEKRK